LSAQQQTVGCRLMAIKIKNNEKSNVPEKVKTLIEPLFKQPCLNQPAMFIFTRYGVFKVVGGQDAVVENMIQLRLHESESKRPRATPLANKPNVFGICNFGNTCWFNSLMQCLYSIPSFRDAILNLNKDSNPWADTWRGMSENMKKNTITELPLLLNLTNKQTNLTIGTQQDTGEAVNVLLNTLPLTIQNMFVEGHKNWGSPYVCLLGIDPFSNINDFFDNMNKNDNKDKDIAILKITRNRDGKRSTESIDFPLHDKGTSLYALLIHKGDGHVESGHYIAIVKRDDVWYEISDSCVSFTHDINEWKKSKNIVMAFYSKKNSGT
jgi:hypothetical protein